MASIYIVSAVKVADIKALNEFGLRVEEEPILYRVSGDFPTSAGSPTISNAKQYGKISAIEGAKMVGVSLSMSLYNALKQLNGAQEASREPSAHIKNICLWCAGGHCPIS